jgi:hypothetical protein
MRRFIVHWLLVVFPSMARAQPVDRIDIIDFGIYKARVDRTVSEPGTAFGQKDIVSNVKLAQ